MKCCKNCFTENELQAFIDANSTDRGICPYCKSHDVELIDIVMLSEYFGDIFRVFKIDKKGKTLAERLMSEWKLFSSLTNSYKFIDDLLGLLNINIHSATDKVIYIDTIRNYLGYWEDFKSQIKHKRRYIVYQDEIEDRKWEQLLNNQTIIEKNEQLYRARIHQSSGSSTYSKKQMGAPPSENSSSGRANPEGIPFLYLCHDKATTLYETRAGYLDEVSIGTFILKENLKIIDFTDFKIEIPFSPDINLNSIIDKIKIILLKRSISADLSKPLRRYDSELEYIPTQYICEFIRYNDADGIKFQSSLHKEGINYVIFDPSKLECVSVKKEKVTRYMVST